MRSGAIWQRSPSKRAQPVRRVSVLVAIFREECEPSRFCMPAGARWSVGAATGCATEPHTCDSALLPRR